MWHMANDRSSMPTSAPPSPTARAGLTRAEFDAIARELQVLRDRHQAELAERLRDARSYGSPEDNEDVLAVHEEASVPEARIGRLEELLRSAPVVDREFDGRASLGCMVRVAGAGGRVAEYVLVGRRSETSSPDEVVGLTRGPGAPWCARWSGCSRGSSGRAHARAAHRRGNAACRTRGADGRHIRRRGGVSVERRHDAPRSCEA